VCQSCWPIITHGLVYQAKYIFCLKCHRQISHIMQPISFFCCCNYFTGVCSYINHHLQLFGLGFWSAVGGFEAINTVFWENFWCLHRELLPPWVPDSMGRLTGIKAIFESVESTLYPEFLREVCSQLQTPRHNQQLTEEKLILFYV
jgi:hypothetical protein